MRIVTAKTAEQLALTVANAAHAAATFAGCGDADLVDRVGSETLALSLDRFVTELRCTVCLCEGKKDKAPWLPEGAEFGSRAASALHADLFADPVEGTKQLAGPATRRTRGSSCIVAVAPAGSVARLFSGCYADKLVLPPGTPAGLTLDSSPGEIVEVMKKTFKRKARDVHAWGLARSRNQEAIDGFQRAGVTVRPIEAGDFEAHLRAGQFVGEDGPVHVSFGIGGLPEGVLAVPFLLWSGATMLLRPHPLPGQHEEIDAAGCHDMLGRVYDARGLIASNDCMLAVAGITEVGHDRPMIRGIRRVEGKSHVWTLVASPAFRELRNFVFDFEGEPDLGADESASPLYASSGTRGYEMHP